MRDAYEAASQINRKLIEQTSRDDARRLSETQVVVARGEYDRGELVLDLCGIPYTLVDPDALARGRLHPDQILYVNCPGMVGEGAIPAIREFVEGGGLLVTTDWALRHVVERAFPGFVAYTGRPTKDDVVRVVFEPVADTFLEGLLDKDDDQLWWLEGSSYPIRVLHPGVKVLLSSAEMGSRYGEPAIALTFEVGAGKVYHLTSHFFLQRTETRSRRHAATGTAYALAKGVALADLDASSTAKLASSNLSEVQSAYTSARSITNLVIEQGRRVNARKGGA